jgi:choline kinase
LKAIILVAGAGRRLRGYAQAPKCMLRVGGTPLLQRYLEALAEMGVSDISVVVGYRKEQILSFLERGGYAKNVRTVVNERFELGSVLSLWAAREELRQDVLLMDGDVYFEDEVLRRLLDSQQENAFAIDTTSPNMGEEVMAGVRDGAVVDVARGLSGAYDTMGECVGFFRLGRGAATEFAAIVGEEVGNGRLEQGYEDLLPRLVSKVRFGHELVDGLRWVEIDFPGDLRRARRLVGRDPEKN